MNRDATISERSLTTREISSEEPESASEPRNRIIYLDAGPLRCDWFDEAERQFEAIWELPSGWDSHGAEAPSRQLLGGAFDLLLSICRAAEVPKPHINPTRAGGVQFEWENGGRYLEVEIVAERAATYFYQDERNQREEEGELFELESVTPLVRLVRAVYAED